MTQRRPATEASCWKHKPLGNSIPVSAKALTPLPAPVPAASASVLSLGLALRALCPQPLPSSPQGPGFHPSAALIQRQTHIC